MRKRITTLLLIFFAVFGLVTCTNNPNQVTNLSNTNLKAGTNVTNVDDSTLTIWWSQGFLPEENEFITQLVANWQKETGKKARLTLVPEPNIKGEVRKAVDVGTTPDVLFNFGGDFDLFPRLAWDNQLADVSSIIEPRKNSFDQTALEAVRYQNNVEKRRSYYAVPIARQGLNTTYWADILAEAGLNKESIPSDWDNFWKFWQKAQDNLRQKGKKDVYGLGMTVSAAGNDSFWEMEHFLEAYNVDLLDDNGQLRLNDPKVRAGLAAAIDQFSSFYKANYVPPSATQWGDADNNVSLLSRESLMTTNPSISIPLTQRQDDNAYNKASRDRYLNKLVTIELPNKPTKEPMRYLVSIKQAVMFQASRNKEAAKSFLEYLLKAENLSRFLKETSKGRIYPVNKELLADPFWTDSSDPHISATAKQFQKPSRLFDMVINPAYNEIATQHIWGKAVVSVIKEGVSPEQAAEKSLKTIEKIFTEWK